MQPLTPPQDFPELPQVMLNFWDPIQCLHLGEADMQQTFLATQRLCKTKSLHKGLHAGTGMLAPSNWLRCHRQRLGKAAAGLHNLLSYLCNDIAMSTLKSLDLLSEAGPLQAQQAMTHPQYLAVAGGGTSPHRPVHACEFFQFIQRVCSSGCQDQLDLEQCWQPLGLSATPATAVTSLHQQILHHVT